MRIRSIAFAVSFLTLVWVSSPPVNGQSSASVKMTPLGSHSGELCRNDRALLFEDPTGVRILYDPGRTVDESDSRLGDVHVMLLSHAHNDHIGDVRPTTGGGTCAAPATGAANPNTGIGLLLPAYAAAFLGSSMFRVGLFTPLGTALGALYLQMVGTGLTILNLTGPVVQMIQGGILIGAVLVSRLTRPQGGRS